ncbi:MAG: D-3-phosphoglycerate dehydrogenase [Myxococcota bacterium]|nr:D-3-phosphoglycerate dehydrogenase [Myxococcota bacterium]
MAAAEKKRVLVSDELSPEGLEVFRRTPGIEVDNRPGLPAGELLNIIGDYHGLAIRSGTKVTKAVIEAAKKLEVIGRAGIGVDNVDTAAATRKGIVVMNTPDGNTVTTAEHTIAMMMSLTRKIPQATASMKSHLWEKNKFQGREVFNKTLGVLGLGNIGRIVADRAHGLKMKVIAYDPFVTPDAARELGVDLVSLEDLCRRADYITVHTPLTPETKGVLGDKAFALMKDGVFIINCARGGIVDEEALARAIQSGKVAGAALDVFAQEPPPKEFPLLDSPQVIATPHLGASTEEAQLNVAIAVAEQMADYLTRGVIRNAVNMPSVNKEMLELVAPYINLGERIGRIQGQLCREGVTEVTVEYRGAVAELRTDPVSIAVQRGLLSAFSDAESINYVNAPVRLKERGIRFTETRNKHSDDFANLITVTCRGKGVDYAIGGALLIRKDPRIVRINNFLLEAVADGYLLLVRNMDQPGVVGRIGTILGEANINISRMQLGLDREHGLALNVINIDSACPPEVLEKLRSVSGVLEVHLLSV